MTNPYCYLCFYFNSCFDKKCLRSCSDTSSNEKPLCFVDDSYCEHLLDFISPELKF